MVETLIDGWSLSDRLQRTRWQKTIRRAAPVHHAMGDRIDHRRRLSGTNATPGTAAEQRACNAVLINPTIRPAP